jgi:hypothetical protein
VTDRSDEGEQRRYTSLFGSVHFATNGFEQWAREITRPHDIAIPQG